MLTAHRPQRAASAILVALLVATACGDPAQRSGEPGTDTARADLRIVAVTHGVSANPFWSVVINGLDDAARDRQSHDLSMVITGIANVKTVITV